MQGFVECVIVFVCVFYAEIQDRYTLNRNARWLPKMVRKRFLGKVPSSLQIRGSKISSKSLYVAPFPS